MPVCHFTREEFEAALPKHKGTGLLLWSPVGLKDGEYVYHVPVRDYSIRIVVRSTVGPDGTSTACGEDSIRLWLEDDSGQPLAPKLAKWTTRVQGWQGRLTKRLRTLYKLGLALTPCPDCGRLRRAYKVRKEGPNKGRVFQACADLHREYLTQAKRPINVEFINL